MTPMICGGRGARAFRPGPRVTVVLLCVATLIALAACDRATPIGKVKATPARYYGQVVTVTCTVVDVTQQSRPGATDA